MNTTDVEATVKMILAEQLGLNVVSFDSSLAGLNADSLDRVEIVMALEDEFGIDIPDEDAEPLDTVGKIIDYVKGKARERC